MTAGDNEDSGAAQSWSIRNAGHYYDTAWNTSANAHLIEVKGIVLDIDNEEDATPGVTLVPTTLEIAEGGSDTYELVLFAEPTANVTVATTSGGDLTASPTSLTFTTTDWNTAQTVTITDGDDTSTVSHAVTSTYTTTAASAWTTLPSRSPTTKRASPYRPPR